jgi:hypothetical protein
MDHNTPNAPLPPARELTDKELDTIAAAGKGDGGAVNTGPSSSSFWSGIVFGFSSSRPRRVMVIS